MTIIHSTRSKFNVVVTGFNVTEGTINSSGEIAALIPDALPRDDPLNVANVDINFLKDERLIIGCTWKANREAIKGLHERFDDQADLWIHLGRGPWQHVTCERRAFRQDFSSAWLFDQDQNGYYSSPDLEDNFIKDLGPCPWMHVPLGLNSELDINSIVTNANRGLQQSKKPLEVRSHVEAASRGCGFTYYESLAHHFSTGRRRDILFTHVPADLDKTALLKGRDAVLAIVGASIDSIRKRKPRAPGDRPEWMDRFDDEP